MAALPGEGDQMLIAPLFGTALILAVATDPQRDPASRVDLTTREKLAATDPLVRSATQCIVHAVTQNPRYAGGGDRQLGDLIVNSMPSCLTSVRAMIDAYDRYYGEGTGEVFFMGPYLDALPKAVAAGGKDAAH
jgi:hypothetical protein